MPFQEVPTPPMTPAWYQRCQQAVHVQLADGQVLRAGRACIHILAVLGYGRLATVLLLPPCRWAVEGVYSLVARHRPFFARWFFTRE